jgi:hypothetical protein
MNTNDETWIPNKATATKVLRAELQKHLLWAAPISAIGSAIKWIFAGDSQTTSIIGISSTVFWSAACVFSSLLSLLALYVYIYRRRMSYSRDSFFGINWTWRYTIDGRVTNLRAWCPRCPSGEIVFQEGVIGRLLSSDNFLCKICSYDSYRSEQREKIPFSPHPEVIRRIEAKRIIIKYNQDDNTGDHRSQ